MSDDGSARADIGAADCGVRSVLLPVLCLLWRADNGGGDLGGAIGHCRGAEASSRVRGRAGEASTLRGSLSRFDSRAELFRRVFTVWLCALKADMPPLRARRLGWYWLTRWPRGTAAAVAAASRWAGPCWSACGRVSWPAR